MIQLLIKKMVSIFLRKLRQVAILVVKSFLARVQYEQAIELQWVWPRWWLAARLSGGTDSKRQEGGQYRDLTNFIGRLPSKYRKVSQLEPLIYAGARWFWFNRKTSWVLCKAILMPLDLLVIVSLFESLTRKCMKLMSFH